MNLAKISFNGEITVPAVIRRLLGLKSGDKVLFFQNMHHYTCFTICYIHMLLPYYLLWGKHSKLHHKPYRKCRIFHLIKIPNEK